LTESAGSPNHRLEEAVLLATQAHAGQLDKAGQPYILHPLRVMLRLQDDDARIAAVLHDTVEDCGIELATIASRFGQHVADAIDALTRRESESYEDFIERCGVNELARRVKQADLADNMDLSRLPVVTKADHERKAKYVRSAKRLTEIARG